jgi:glycosyltransferase involved in cell wall biosynthesis
VALLGRVPDETRDLLFAACDVFVQPNIEVPGDMEGFGIVVLEAASFGAPVVAARIEGLRDAIADGVSGILVTSESRRGFLGEIERLLSDERARRALGESARAYVAEHYAWPRIALRYLEAMADHLPKDRDGRAA